MCDDAALSPPEVGCMHFSKQQNVTPSVSFRLHSDLRRSVCPSLCAPRLRAAAMERPDSLDTSDIDGAQSKPLPVRRTPHYFNTNADIDASMPYAFSKGKSGRSTDPLTPAYQYPSFTPHPEPPATAGSVRDVLWTLPQRNWKPAPREVAEWSEAEKYGRQHLFQKTVQSRTSLQVHDITGPQFRIEERRWRQTDPLAPVYQYDGAPIDAVRTRRPHYGSQFPRTESEDFALKTDDILTEKVFNREYPKVLIKTRFVNRTDDITGAQADTRCAAPKLWKVKDPAMSAEKLTNRVMDIDGAVAGTGGQGPPLYRTRKQAAAIAATAGSRAMSASFGSTRPLTGAPSAAMAARDADIASVHALK